MTLIFKIFGTIIMLLVFLICTLACVYIITIELNELFEVDILFKLKRKVERWCYAERKTMGRMFKRRTQRGRKNRTGHIPIKRRIREKIFEQKAILTKKEKVARENRKSLEEV